MFILGFFMDRDFLSAITSIARNRFDLMRLNSDSKARRPLNPLNDLCHRQLLTGHPSVVDAQDQLRPPSLQHLIENQAFNPGNQKGQSAAVAPGPESLSKALRIRD
jgi:hypothetical protein